MTSPWRLKFIALAFFGLTTAISVNALYLQNSNQPSTKAPGEVIATSPANESAPPVEIKPVKSSVQSVESLGKPPAPSSETRAPTPSMDTIKAVQRELARLGYRVGAEDGRIRIMTREALIAYEFDRGLPLTGEPSERVLKDMLFASAAPKDLRNLSAQRFETNPQMVRHVQDFLAGLGFGPPSMTGQMDEPTRAALRQFQSNRKLAANGALSERLLLEICIVTGKPLAFNP